MDNGASRIVLTELFSAGGDLNRYPWKPFHQGVEIHRLYGGGSGAASAALLRYAPGARVPHHVHLGYEHILVLSGSQEDERGVYRPGTLLISGPGTDHVVTSREGCVVLAIWEIPVDMRVQSAPAE